MEEMRNDVVAPEMLDAGESGFTTDSDGSECAVDASGMSLPLSCSKSLARGSGKRDSAGLKDSEVFGEGGSKDDETHEIVDLCATDTMDSIECTSPSMSSTIAGQHQEGTSSKSSPQVWENSAGMDVSSSPSTPIEDTSLIQIFPTQVSGSQPSPVMETFDVEDDVQVLGMLPAKRNARSSAPNIHVVVDDGENNNDVEEGFRLQISSTVVRPFDCPICLEEVPRGGQACILGCEHRFCFPCIQTFVSKKVEEAQVRNVKITIDSSRFTWKFMLLFAVLWFAVD
jgi:hypothetical protein